MSNPSSCWFQNKSFELPAGAEVSNSSSCGKENASDPSLVITFGRGHTLTLTFTRNATRYKVQLMRFAYNLSDTDTFPNSSFTGKNQCGPAMGWRELGWGISKLLLSKRFKGQELVF